MTRKDELEARAAQWLSQHGDARLRQPLTALLQQVERGVLQRVSTRYHRHEYLLDPRTFAEWMKDQQKELG